VSNSVFPSFPLTVQGRPMPFFETTVQRGDSGPEYRVKRKVVGYRYPLELTLREWEGEPAALIAFFLDHDGRRDSFLFTGKDGVQRRVRFDTDDLSEDLGYEAGGIYKGTIELVTVGA
jgi:hypothetical protein